MLGLEGVRVWRAGAEILKGIDLAFEPGRRYVIVGASGSGKSTLLRLLNRLEDPGGGAVFAGAIPLTGLASREVRRGVGLVPQNAPALPGTVAENLAYPFRVRRRAVPDREAMAGALEEFGLAPEMIDREAEGLSGGERQRLAIAVALGGAPEILALDEPTAGLDPRSARVVAEALARRSAEGGLRTIVVTHHREHAAWMGEIAVALEGGRVVDRGPTAEVLARVDLDVGSEMQVLGGATEGEAPG